MEPLRSGQFSSDPGACLDPKYLAMERLLILDIIQCFSNSHPCFLYSTSMIIS